MNLKGVAPTLFTKRQRRKILAQKLSWQEGPSSTPGVSVSLQRSGGRINPWRSSCLWPWDFRRPWPGRLLKERLKAECSQPVINCHRLKRTYH